MLKVWRSLFGAAVLGISSAALSHAQHGRSPQMQADDAECRRKYPRPYPANAIPRARCLNASEDRLIRPTFGHPKVLNRIQQDRLALAGRIARGELTDDEAEREGERLKHVYLRELQSLEGKRRR